MKINASDFDRVVETLQYQPPRLSEHQYGHGEDSECHSENVCQASRIRKFSIYQIHKCRAMMCHVLLCLQENFVKLAELQRDLGGYENLLHPEREFQREGCLQKLSRKGYQQRMFFLVSIDFARCFLLFNS